MKDDAFGSEDIEISFFGHRSIDESAFPAEVRVFVVKGLLVIIHIEDDHFPADLSLLGDLKVLFQTFFAHDVVPWRADGSSDIVGRTDGHSFHRLNPETPVGFHTLVDGDFWLIGFREQFQIPDEVFGDILLAMNVLEEAIRIESLEMSDMLFRQFRNEFSLEELVECFVDDASMESRFADDFTHRCLPDAKEREVYPRFIGGKIQFFELCEGLLAHSVVFPV